MTLPRARFATVGCLIIGVAALSGCTNTRENKAGREGLPEKIGNVEYNVFITRELNLKDVEDSGYYKGPEAPPGYALYGVFLQACNQNTSGPNWTAASNFQIEDTQGNTFKPLPTAPDNIWSYRAESLGHASCIPKTGSLASSGPTTGSLLVFKLPLQTLENRPLDLRITAPQNAAGVRDSGLIELDI